MSWRDWLPERPGPLEAAARDHQAAREAWHDEAIEAGGTGLTQAQGEQLCVDVWEARDQDRAVSGADRQVRARAAGESSQALRRQIERDQARRSNPLRTHGSHVRAMDRQTAARDELARREAEASR